MPEPGRLDERVALEASLDYQRETFLMKCGGLTAEQLRLRSAPPSSMSLLGLLRHLAAVERWWFRMNLAGEPLDHLFFDDTNLDGDFDDVDTADAESDFAAEPSLGLPAHDRGVRAPQRSCRSVAGADRRRHRRVASRGTSRPQPRRQPALC
jgi:hypothetical protein